MGTRSPLLNHPWEVEARLEGSRVWRSVVNPPRRAPVGPHPPPAVTWENNAEQYAAPGCRTPGPYLLTVAPLGCGPLHSSLVTSVKPQPAFQEVTSVVTQPGDNWHTYWMHIK